MESSQLDNIVLALLFASDEPLSAKRIAGLLGDVEVDDIKKSINDLKNKIGGDFESIVVERVAGGCQLATNPVYAEYIARLYSGKRKQRLSKAGMETLAIIAYKQPITRADIENIRGVSCGGVVTTLMERSLIKISGKAKVLGAPFLYSTTTDFLEYLGLNTLKDLPSMDELETLLEREESAHADQSRPAGEDAEATVSPDATDPEDSATDEQSAGDEDPADAASPAGATSEPFVFAEDTDDDGVETEAMKGPARIDETFEDPIPQLDGQDE